MQGEPQYTGMRVHIWKPSVVSVGFASDVHQATFSRMGRVGLKLRQHRRLRVRSFDWKIFMMTAWLIDINGG